LIYNRSEFRAIFIDQALDMLVKVWMTDYTIHIIGDTLHILKDFIELSDELTLGWLECHSFCCKADGCLDTILFSFFLHFR
jgi:hypothetical protein